jgi:hypothetical protein
MLPQKTLLHVARGGFVASGQAERKRGAADPK